MSAKTQVREYKRELILSAATKLFYEKGFQKTTIDDIGAELGVTKPFIYTYFKNKYAILEAWFDQAFFDLYEDIADSLGNSDGSPVERLHMFVTVYVRSNIERQRFTAIMLEEEKNLTPEKIADIRAKQREFDVKLARLIAEGVASGDFHVEDPRIASLAVSGMVRWVHRWYSDKGRMSPEDLAASLAQLALNLVGYHPALAATPHNR